MHLSAYRIMWLFVFFDLPTLTKAQRKLHAKFRKSLMADGFNMVQFSVYNRFCSSPENAETHLRRIEHMLPPEGKVMVLKVTDKQYSGIKVFWGEVKQALDPPPQQLELF